MRPPQQRGVCWCKLRTLRVRASSPAENIALDPQEGTRDPHWKPKGRSPRADRNGRGSLAAGVEMRLPSSGEFAGADSCRCAKLLTPRGPSKGLKGGRIGCRSPSAASSTAWSLLAQTPIVARNSSPQRPNRSPRGSLSPWASVTARGLLSNSVRCLSAGLSHQSAPMDFNH